MIYIFEMIKTGLNEYGIIFSLSKRVTSLSLTDLDLFISGEQLQSVKTEYSIVSC